MSTSAILHQLFQNVLVLLAAPLLLGWINQCRAWLQNRSGPGMLQPFRNLLKLFHKDAVLAHNASALFRATPYILFTCMWLAAAMATRAFWYSTAGYSDTFRRLHHRGSSAPLRDGCPN